MKSNSKSKRAGVAKMSELATYESQALGRIQCCCTAGFTSGDSANARRYSGLDNAAALNCRASDFGLKSKKGFLTIRPLRLLSLLKITVAIILLHSYCCHWGAHGSTIPTFATPGSAGRDHERSMLQVATYNANCTRVYTTTASETCASLRSTQNLSQSQLLQLNPELNCKTLAQGQSVCVDGFPENCKTTVQVTQGPATSDTTCAAIISAANLSTEGFNILNPGISCPEAPGNNNSWPADRTLCVAPGLGRIFFEYMGASGNEITFNDIQPLVQYFSFVIYHVVLAFAIDADANGVLQNGNFTPYWSSELDPFSALAFKADNPGVRILVSLGGSSQWISPQRTVNVVWEDPANPDEWIANAQASLTVIAEDYDIDGVDIDYENFPNSSSTFAYCIGTLVQRLKDNNTIGTATIAPFGSVIPQYVDLMSGYGDFFDYINFQFYGYDLYTVDSYVQQYDSTAQLFPPWKLLASTQIDGNITIKGPTFVTALVQLEEFRGLAGVMVWEADDSVGSDFADERSYLTYLTNSAINNDSISPAPALAPAPAPELAPEPAPPGPASAPGAVGAPGSARAPGSSSPPNAPPASAPTRSGSSTPGRFQWRSSRCWWKRWPVFLTPTFASLLAAFAVIL